MSVSTLLMMVVTIGGTFGFMIFMRKRLNTQYAHMRFGDVATRLGLRLVEGDPTFNLVTMSMQPSAQNLSSAGGFLQQVAATNVGGTLGEIKMKAMGDPYGSSTELVLYCRQDFEPGIVQNVTTTYHDLRLTMLLRGSVSPFELRLRNETMHLETRRDCTKVQMPAQSFGAPDLDARFVMECFDSSLPRRIAAAVALLPAHAVYVHVTGEGNAISFVMTPASVNASAMAFEQVLHVLAAIASLVEGRAIPAPRAGEAPRLAA